MIYTVMASEIAPVRIYVTISITLAEYIANDCRLPLNAAKSEFFCGCD